MIYADTSALAKLVFEEVESGALAELPLDQVDVLKISSDLTVVELPRVCRRVAPERIPDASDLLGGFDLLPVDRQVIEDAAALEASQLRCLDAIHLASALTLSDALTAFVAYDDRLFGLAQEAGPPFIAPCLGQTFRT